MQNKHPPFDGDQLNADEQPDRLGFAAIAEKLSVSVMDQATAGGIVVGVEGKWGSGKSSLVARTASELRKRDGGPEIVDFAPWLISSRDALIGTLLTELAAAARRIEGWAESAQAKTKKKTHSAKDTLSSVRESAEAALARYGENVGRLGKLVKIAGIVVPGTELAGTAIEHGADWMKTFAQSKDLKEQKDSVSQKLGALDRRIVVLIDDLDRLEPAEMIEVLRLVRSVANFPNVIYVLSYDREAVARALEIQLKLVNGIEYLEKFIQVSFKIPKPEDFDLRRWFRAEVTAMLADHLDGAGRRDKRDVARRLDEYIDMAGGRYLHTPRDVVRTLNALKLYAPPVADCIYLPDLIWLQLIRVNDAELYDWVESYVTTTAAVAGGARLSEGASQRALEELKKVLTKQNRQLEDVIWELHEVLPGVNWVDKNKHRDGRQVFDELTDAHLRAWVSLRRLGSPQHFRYYFALTQPQGIVTDNEVEALIDAARHDRQRTTESLANLAQLKRPTGGVALEPLISRLLALRDDELPETAIPNLLHGLSDVVDEASLAAGDRSYGMDWLAISAERAFRHLLGRVDAAATNEIIKKVFEEGRALGWMVGLLADDVYARGLAGDKDRGSHESYFSTDQFEQARKVIVERLKSSSGEAILGVPRLLPVLYGWKYLGDPKDVTAWCAEQTKTDEGLLRFLSKSRGWANASGIGVYYPLNKRSLSEFIDYDSARAGGASSV